ncbi:MAG: helix-turn-helix domain-containing protein [Deltaproteobacteria bacterium]|nr:helix-turn-helix domain-containing protein [Deltaproteobacteria bacterium]
MKPAFMTLRSAAQYLGYSSIRPIQNIIDREEIRLYRLTPRGRWLIKRAELDELMERKLWVNPKKALKQDRVEHVDWL